MYLHIMKWIQGKLRDQLTLFTTSLDDVINTLQHDSIVFLKIYIQRVKPMSDIFRGRNMMGPLREIKKEWIKRKRSTKPDKPS